MFSHTLPLLAFHSFCGKEQKVLGKHDRESYFFQQRLMCCDHKTATTPHDTFYRGFLRGADAEASFYYYSNSEAAAAAAAHNPYGEFFLLCLLNIASASQKLL